MNAVRVFDTDRSSPLKISSARFYSISAKAFANSLRAGGGESVALASGGTLKLNDSIQFVLSVAEEAKGRIIFSLKAFEFTVDQLRRIEEILNE